MQFSDWIIPPYLKFATTNAFSFQNMPIFGESSSPYDEFVEKVTAETLTSENWELMMWVLLSIYNSLFINQIHLLLLFLHSSDICDKTNADPKGPKLCLLSVKKRLNHRDPHVVLLALSLLDCLWSNCGQKFRREVSSKEFINELNYKCTNVKQTPRTGGNKSKGASQNVFF
jgi:signal transducing adaptor molecule